jgi:hypothetical protein
MLWLLLLGLAAPACSLVLAPAACSGGTPAGASAMARSPATTMRFVSEQGAGPEGTPKPARVGHPLPKRYIPFETARFGVQRLGLCDEAEWRQWISDQKPGITSKRWWYMPSHPDRAYPADWQGWDDWLGVPLSFDEARAVVASLHIQSQEHWWVVAREQATKLQRLRVPARPHLYYAEQWLGYTHWLGLPETPLVLPRDYGKGRTQF